MAVIGHAMQDAEGQVRFRNLFCAQLDFIHLRGDPDGSRLKLVRKAAAETDAVRPSHLSYVCWPGVARRPLTFFASPKKVSKERRPQNAALRVPAQATRQAGSETNSLRSDKFHFFIRLAHHLDGSISKRGTSKATATPKPKTQNPQTALQANHKTMRMNVLTLGLLLFLTYPRLSRCR